MRQLPVRSKYVEVDAVHCVAAQSRRGGVQHIPLIGKKQLWAPIEAPNDGVRAEADVGAAHRGDGMPDRVPVGGEHLHLQHCVLRQLLLTHRNRHVVIDVAAHRHGDAVAVTWIS